MNTLNMFSLKFLLLLSFTKILYVSNECIESSIRYNESRNFLGSVKLTNVVSQVLICEELKEFQLEYVSLCFCIYT